MKKILSFLGTITLIGTSTTSLIACNKPQQYTYTEEQLKELKDKNNIKTKDGALEWISSQEKQFNKVDNKWYFAVWRGIYKNNITDWRIIKFKHNELKNKTVDSYDTYKLNLIWIWYPFSWWYDIGIETKQGGFSAWWFETYPNIKSVYRWDGDGEPNTPEIDFKTGKIINQNN
ncbi:lipoprotein [Spiroplasma endosymbiont of Polydrusus cervinus]|uniref:lipoprotein n=1 Tax=Spiroplasma endosymbiont of Polydrusus cervinus TaxID=3066287 RepID=UPI0030CBC2BC